MSLDDYALDDLERSQVAATRRRRQRRSQRHYRLSLIGGGFLALFLLTLPSLMSYSGMMHSLVRSQFESSGWKAQAEGVQLGWLTPLSIQKLKLEGPSGNTTIVLQDVDTALTVTGFLAGGPQDWGDVALHGVAIDFEVFEGGSSLEDDVAAMMDEDDANESAGLLGSFVMDELTATVTDHETKRRWSLDRSTATVTITEQAIAGELAGVLHDGQSGGAIESQFQWGIDNDVQVNGQPLQIQPMGASGFDPAWQITVGAKSFPLSVVNLASRRFAKEQLSLPESLQGHSSGRFTAVGTIDGQMQAELQNVLIRDLTVETVVKDSVSQSTTQNTSSKTRRWSNDQATFNGRFALTDQRVLGRGLEVTTDFASATLDGGFPRTLSLVGTDDNLLAWLQSLDGTATINVDLPKLHHSLPGIIPLRPGAKLVAGAANATITNDPQRRRSELKVLLNPIHAEAEGRPVLIDRITMNAIVVNDQEQLNAERFEFLSSFANASGSGNLRQGTAQVNVDFGRLYAMLRPVIDLSNLSLGGNATGQIAWNARPSFNTGNQQRLDLWQLSGDGKAENLLVSFPSGDSFHRQRVTGKVVAQGQWSQNTLVKLTAAEANMASGGVTLHAALDSPVDRPDGDSIYPVRMEFDGQLENLAQSLRPWIPRQLLDAKGRMTGTAEVDLARHSSTLKKTDFVITEPELLHDGYWYTQPYLSGRFEGALRLPAGTASIKRFEAIGEAISIAMRGEAAAEKTSLEASWKSNLHALKGAIREQVSSGITNGLSRPQTSPAAFSDYSLAGRVAGTIKLTGDRKVWSIDTRNTVTQLLVSQNINAPMMPPQGLGRTVSTGNTVAPPWQPTPGGPATQSLPPHVLWSEPKVTLDSRMIFQPEKQTLQVELIQLTSQAASASLQGQTQPLATASQPESWNTKLTGTARWQSEELAKRFTQLLQTPITAAGLHDCPIEVQIGRGQDGQLNYKASGELQWDRCTIEGITAGPARLRYETTGSQTRIHEVTIPLLAIAPMTNPKAMSPGHLPNQHIGKATFALTMLHNEGPTLVTLDPGAKIEQLQVTAQSSEHWLKYLTPLAANAARLEGILDANFDQVTINVDDPGSSVMKGELQVKQLRLASGPLTEQVIQGLDELRSLAKLELAPKPAQMQRTLVEMPPQNVEFNIKNRRVTHQRMLFNIDKAQLLTQGSVGFDSTLNLVAAIPLDERWLGQDLKSMHGQSLTFPVAGTISNPRLDRSMIRNIMLQLGQQAGQQAVERGLDNLLEKQLDNGLNQINSGLDKLFGR